VIGFASPYLAEAKIALVALALAGSAAGSAWVTAMVKNAEIAGVRQADVARERDDLKMEVSLQSKIAGTDAQVSRAFAQDMDSESVVTRTIIKEIPVHVSSKSDAQYPLPYGAIRVYDAAILGTDPAALSLPAGRTDDSAAPVGASALAENAAENYAACRTDAEQLSLLEKWIALVGENSSGANGQ